MICMIPKLNLVVGKIGFMFCDLHVSLKYPFIQGYKFDEFTLFDFGIAWRHIRFSEFLLQHYKCETYLPACSLTLVIQLVLTIVSYFRACN